jgi:hypothetical protein
MARTRTLAELRAEVRDRADMENAPHITDTQITRYVNQSIARLWNKITQLDASSFFDDGTTTLAAGSSTVTLPANFWRLSELPVLCTSGDTTWRLRRLQLGDLASVWEETGRPTHYRVDTGGLSVFPTPESSVDVTLFYITAPAQLSADADTFDGRAGWEEWVVLDAAVKCIMKEEGDASGLVAEREAIWADIEAAVRTPDMSEPRRVQDVEDVRDRRGWRWEL